MSASVSACASAGGTHSEENVMGRIEGKVALITANCRSILRITFSSAGVPPAEAQADTEADIRAPR